jgi:hypothetical protein
MGRKEKLSSIAFIQTCGSGDCGRARETFWRSSTGQAVELLFEVGTRLQGVGIKSGATLVSDWRKGLAKWRACVGDEALPGGLIHGGLEGYTREGVQVFPWQAIGEAAGASLTP